MFPLADHVRLNGMAVVTEYVITLATPNGQRPYYFFLQRRDAERELARLKREFPERLPRLSVQMRLAS